MHVCASTRSRMGMRGYVCACMCSCVLTSVRMIACMRVIECVRVGVCLCVHVFVYMQVCVHMGVHMHVLYMSGHECVFVYI